VGDEVLHLLPAGLFKGFYAAVIDGVGLDQNRLELVLPDKLTEAVTQVVLAVGPVAVDGWGGRLRSLLSEACDPEKDPISSTEQIPLP
jgi:hypothetical protein